MTPIDTAFHPAKERFRRTRADLEGHKYPPAGLF